MDTQLDRYDHAILAALEEDGRQAFTTLADTVGLSKTPCWTRVQSLEEAGVITGYRTVIDPDALGLRQRAYLQVSVAFDAYEEFERAVDAHPAIIDCHTIAGEADYLLHVIAADMAALDTLLRKELSRMPGVQRFSTIICMKTIKREGAVTAAARRVPVPGQTKAPPQAPPPGRGRGSKGA